MFAELFHHPSPIEQVARFAEVVALAGFAAALGWLLIFAVRRLAGRPARLSAYFWGLVGCSVELLAFFLVAEWWA